MLLKGRMEADISNCRACAESGQTTALKKYHLNFNEVVHLCPNKQCIYHLQNARLEVLPIEENTSKIQLYKAINPYKDVKGKTCMIQWKNKYSLCWLDVSMCLLVKLDSFHQCVGKVTQICALKNLCTNYDLAQNIYDGNEMATDEESINTSNCNSVAFGHVNLLDELRDCTLDDQPVEPQDYMSGQTLQGSLVSINESAHHLGACSRQVRQLKVMNILDDTRDAIFHQLQPILKCDIGDEDSPLFAIPALLKDSQTFEEHFMSRYHCEFHCNICGCMQVSIFQKIIPSFPEVPTDFDIHRPEMLQPCPECNAEQQKRIVVYHRLSQCMMMHFVKGLPHNQLDKLDMSINGDEYKLTAVIQYKQNPKHFVVWIRDVHENLWVECDDLMSFECRWSHEQPDIPPKEIHIIVLERQQTQCGSCLERDNYVTTWMKSSIGVKAMPSRKHSPDLFQQPADPYSQVVDPSPQRTINLTKDKEESIMNENTFIGRQTSQFKSYNSVKSDSNKAIVQTNSENYRENRRSVSDSILLNKYLNTCVKGKVLSSNGVREGNIGNNSEVRRKRKMTVGKLQEEHKDKVSVVMAAIPERLLSHGFHQKNRRCNALQRNSTKKNILTVEPSLVSHHVRRRYSHAYTGDKGRFPSYTKLDNNDGLKIKECMYEGFRKNVKKDCLNPSAEWIASPNPSVISTIHSVSSPSPSFTSPSSSISSPNSSVASGLSTISHMQSDSTEDTISTFSQCSIDSGNASEDHNSTLNSIYNALDVNNELVTSIYKQLDDNQDDFLSSLLETNFVSSL